MSYLERKTILAKSILTRLVRKISILVKDREMDFFILVLTFTK